MRPRRPRDGWGGETRALFGLIAGFASGVFLILAARWRLVLRRTALDARLPLTRVDKLLAAAPIGYTVLCFTAAGRLADFIGEILAAGGPTTRLPLFGEVDYAVAVWLVGVVVGLAITTPPVIVFAVESHFARRLPLLVVMGRRAVWATLTGVRVSDKPEAGGAPPDEEDARWKRLLT